MTGSVPFQSGFRWQKGTKPDRFHHGWRNCQGSKTTPRTQIHHTRYKTELGSVFITQRLFTESNFIFIFKNGLGHFIDPYLFCDTALTSLTVESENMPPSKCSVALEGNVIQKFECQPVSEWTVYFFRNGIIWNVTFIEIDYSIHWVIVEFSLILKLLQLLNIWVDDKPICFV